MLTQFNSASLNRHIAQTYRMDMFSGGFVEVLAAEQTPEGEQWFQGTADAVRQAARHFRDVDAEYYLILAGDHVYRMDFAELIESHIERNADITIAAQPVAAGRRHADGHLPLRRRAARSSDSKRSRRPSGCARCGSSAPTHCAGRPALARQAVPGLDGHLRLLARRALRRAGPEHAPVDFGREIIPQALSTHRVHAYLYRGFWADVGTVAVVLRRQPDADASATPPFNFFHPRRPIYTHPRFLPAARVHDCHVDEALIADGAYLDTCDGRRAASSACGRRSMRARGSRARSCSAPTTTTIRRTDLPLGIGKNAVLDRVIVDKNARIGDGARLVNERGIENADGDGYYIRSGIIVVPKNGIVKPGTVV